MTFVFKQCAACLLLLAVLLQTFSKAMIYVNFYVNQNYIARTLCENRDRPMMHCNGHCQLRKRLADEHSSDKRYPAVKDNEIRNLFFDRRGQVATTSIPPIVFLRHGPGLYNKRIIHRPADIFHPPD